MVFVGPEPLPVPSVAQAMAKLENKESNMPISNNIRREWRWILLLAATMFILMPAIVSMKNCLLHHYYGHRISVSFFPVPRRRSFTPLNLWKKGYRVRAIVSVFVWILNVVDILLETLQIPISVCECQLFPKDPTTFGELDELKQSGFQHSGITLRCQIQSQFLPSGDDDDDDSGPMTVGMRLGGKEVDCTHVAVSTIITLSSSNNSMLQSDFLMENKSFPYDNRLEFELRRVWFVTSLLRNTMRLRRIDDDDGRGPPA